MREITKKTNTMDIERSQSFNSISIHLTRSARVALISGFKQAEFSRFIARTGFSEDFSVKTVFSKHNCHPTPPCHFPVFEFFLSKCIKMFQLIFTHCASSNFEALKRFNCTLRVRSPNLGPNR